MSDTDEMDGGTIKVELIENRKILNDATYSIASWLFRHKMEWLAVIIMKSYMTIFGEYKTYRVKK